MLSSAWYKAVLSHMIYSMLFMPPFCVFRKKVLVAIHTLIFSDHNLEQFSIKSYTVFFVKKWELIRLKPFIIYSCLQFAFLFPVWLGQRGKAFYLSKLCYFCKFWIALTQFCWEFFCSCDIAFCSLLVKFSIYSSWSW